MATPEGVSFTKDCSGCESQSIEGFNLKIPHLEFLSSDFSLKVLESPSLNL
jgi:hypothetical protein